jgi:signal transduction histidine kinase
LQFEDSFFKDLNLDSDDDSSIDLQEEQRVKDLKKTIYQNDLKDKIVFAVQDTGTGIKKKDQENLFKMFGCLNSTKQMNTQGIGLGLFICKKIV